MSSALRPIELGCLGVLALCALASASIELFWGSRGAGSLRDWVMIPSVLGLVLSSLVQAFLWLALLFSERALPLRAEIAMAAGAGVFFGLLAGIAVNAYPDTFASLSGAQPARQLSPPTVACFSVGLLCAGAALWARLQVVRRSDDVSSGT